MLGVHLLDVSHTNVVRVPWQVAGLHDVVSRNAHASSCTQSGKSSSSMHCPATHTPPAWVPLWMHSCPSGAGRSSTHAATPPLSSQRVGRHPPCLGVHERSAQVSSVGGSGDGSEDASLDEQLTLPKRPEVPRIRTETVHRKGVRPDQDGNIERDMSSSGSHRKRGKTTAVWWSVVRCPSRSSTVLLIASSCSLAACVLQLEEVRDGSGQTDGRGVGGGAGAGTAGAAGSHMAGPAQTIALRPNGPLSHGVS
jgi:hypothetical protein